MDENAELQDILGVARDDIVEAGGATAYLNDLPLEFLHLLIWPLELTFWFALIKFASKCHIGLALKSLVPLKCIA